MNTKSKTIPYSLSEIKSVAQEIIDQAQNQKIWLFTGELGAGKTTLIKELAHQLGSRDTISSPTYTLVNQYLYPKGNIYHMDAYRIQSEQEAYDIGIEEILYSGDYVWIEWPKKNRNLFTCSLRFY